MKILITGITSALGTAIAGRLTQHEIIGLGRKKHKKYPTVICDLSSPLPRLPAADVCVHLASVTDMRYCQEQYKKTYQINVTATKNLLKTAQRFVYVSTGSVYGFSDDVSNENSLPRPENPYAKTKLLAEREVAIHDNSVILRYFFPYGPGMKTGSLVNRLIDYIKAGIAVDLHENGKPRINPIHVSDLTEATKLICLQNQKGIFNLAGTETVTIQELAELIGDMLKKKPVYRQTKNKVADMRGATDKLAKVYQPTIDLAHGIRETIDALQARSQT